MTTFWHERWREGRIGFHEGQVNEFLARHVASLGERRRVLVPLCGKTEDLAYLASLGHEVVGVEMVPEAAAAFFAEHPGTPVQIVVSDFFAVTAAQVGAIDAFYDRAALIALPPALRARYVAHLRGLLAPGARGLVIALEYPQALADGPPFSVPDDEVRELWAGAAIELVDSGVGENPRLRAAGAEMIERCYAITR